MRRHVTSRDVHRISNDFPRRGVGDIGDSAAVLEVASLAKSYGDVHALVDVDLVVERGEVVGLLGPNGAGKTTLVSIVAGLRSPDSGTVLVDGIDVVRDPDGVHSRIALAPQELGIYPTVSARENLLFFAELAGFRGKSARQRVEQVAESLNLTDKLDARAESLSGGQKRRLHAGMALIGTGELLLLDEPTAGADVETRGQLLEVVRERAAAGAAVVYSTHYLHEIEQLAANVAILDGGRIVVRGPCQELIASRGTSVVELAFDGEPPHDGAAFAHAEVHGDVARFATSTPDEVAAAAMKAAMADGLNVRRLEIIRPSLETVYLSVVGRRYEGAAVEAEL
ncbi:MAG: type transport system ATP-binding protein [Actinomycetota bacterium]